MSVTARALRLTGARRSVGAVVRSRPLAAAVAQMWQAVASFAVQLVAAHMLGASGLGALSLCLGVMVMAGALTSGMVGDSLTVLDRFDPSIRAGLQWWALVLGVGSSALSAFALLVTGVLDSPASALFFGASILFQLKELARRVLMAVMRFWSLVAIDCVSVAASLGALWLLARGDALSLDAFLVAVLVGQALGCVAAVALLPAKERSDLPWRNPAVGAVAAFGLWRGAQVAVNPTALTAVRSLVVAAAGAAALGAVEAARMLVAPATLAVQGVGSYLLSSYARDRELPVAQLVHRAVRASVLMCLGVTAVGAGVAALTPVLGPLVSGSSFPVSPWAVFGWAVYTAAIASLQPFASLAAARGYQRQVFAVRVGDSLLAVVVVLAALAWLHLPAAVVPFGLAVGPLCAGVAIRVLVLARLQTSPDRSVPAAAGARRRRSTLAPRAMQVDHA